MTPLDLAALDADLESVIDSAEHWACEGDADLAQYQRVREGWKAIRARLAELTAERDMLSAEVGILRSAFTKRYIVADGIEPRAAGSEEK